MLWQLLGSSIFVACAVLTFYYAKKSRYQPDKAGNFFTNEVLVGILYILTAILYPFFYLDSGISPETLDTMYLISFLLWTAEIALFVGMILKEKARCARNPQLLVDRDYERIKAAYRANYRYDVKKDFERKGLHLLTVFIIVIAWQLGLILNSFSNLPLSMTAIAFYKWMVNTIGFAFLIMFATGDLVRLMKNAYLPSWAVKCFTSALKEDELVTFSATAPLILGLVPFLFAPFQLFLSVALITSLADAAASLIGKQFGKHHLSTTSKKTFEGLFAGAFAAFTIVALAMGTYSPITMTKVFSMATIAACLFVIVDIYTHKLSDNIVNSLACGTGIVLAFLLI